MKMSELREMTNEELNQQLETFREEMFNLRFQQSANRLENPMRLKSVRKDIARIKTLLTEKESSTKIRGNDDK
ncbi:MAG: 50S ribosomal protein L29 [Candidatus Cloacimonetes bacterium]|nr:50S ribosomal protein L29 [Candidatus Cloacimonadota bacterium]